MPISLDVKASASYTHSPVQEKKVNCCKKMCNSNTVRLIVAIASAIIFALGAVFSALFLAGLSVAPIGFIAVILTTTLSGLSAILWGCAYHNHKKEEEEEAKGLQRLQRNRSIPHSSLLETDAAFPIGQSTIFQVEGDGEDSPSLSSSEDISERDLVPEVKEEVSVSSSKSSKKESVTIAISKAGEQSPTKDSSKAGWFGGK